MSGNISDGPLDYANGMTCEWLISGEFVSLSFTFLDTEYYWDRVWVYGCSSPSCSSSSREQLRSDTAVFSGDLSHDPTAYTTSAGHMQVIFTSDHATTGAGFSATYTISQKLPDPTPAASLTCSGSCGCVSSSGVSSGIISDGSGPLEYDGGLDCEWLLAGVCVYVCVCEWLLAGVCVCVYVCVRENGLQVCVRVCV